MPEPTFCWLSKRFLKVRALSALLGWLRLGSSCRWSVQQCSPARESLGLIPSAEKPSPRSRILCRRCRVCGWLCSLYRNGVDGRESCHCSCDGLTRSQSSSEIGSRWLQRGCRDRTRESYPVERRRHPIKIHGQ